MRTKPPTTRKSLTHKLKLCDVALYVTIGFNEDGEPIEIFGKASDGWQSWLDVLCETASLALQHGCPIETITKHWRGHRFAPDGIVGQGTSIPDSIARWLEGEPWKGGDNT